MTERSVQLGTWLQVARAQERDRGVDFRELACYASKLTPHIQDHLAPALQDLELLYAELPAAVSAEEDQREFWESYRTEYIRRIRGALEHISSALVAVGCTDEELLADPEPSPEPEDEDAEPSEDDDSEDGEGGAEETVSLPLPEIRQAVGQDA
jgi:hypothetical protein